MASASRIMDKPRHQQQQEAAAAAATLKCPRCDSSNTKFCYYNNYSLAQPRHFCKACKRYWTRGGTLRNVPVGGGCRKNKRIKTSSSSSVNASVTSAPSQNPRLHKSSINTTTTTTNVSSLAANHINGPMFFGVNNANPSPLNLHFSSLDSGFGFSSSGLLSHFADLREGFNSPKQIQDHISINSMNHFHHPSISFDRNSQLFGNFEASLMTPMKEGKIEGINRLYQNNQTEQIDLSNLSDPSPYWSSATVATGNWHGQGNNGSSIASLF